MKSWFNRDGKGNVMINSNGFATIICEEIDKEEEQMCFNVNGKHTYIDNPWKHSEIEKVNTIGGNTPTTSKGGNAVFRSSDTSTKIFLKEHKAKKELVSNGRLKSLKEVYQEIAKNLTKNGLNVSFLQVENKYRTLRYVHKTMPTMFYADCEECKRKEYRLLRRSSSYCSCT